MKLQELKSYVSRLQINPNKSNFCDEYTEIMTEVLLFYDEAIKTESESESEAHSDLFCIIEEKFEQRWKGVFCHEYNESLKAFNGATCPIGAHILYWCYKQVPLLFLKYDVECYCNAPDSALEDFIKERYRNMYGLVNKMPVELFRSVTMVYDCDYFRDDENQWRKDAIKGLFSRFGCKSLKRLCAEIMIEYIDAFQKCYAEYLPQSFLDACVDDKDFLVQVRDSLPN